MFLNCLITKFVVRGRLLNFLFYTQFTKIDICITFYYLPLDVLILTNVINSANRSCFDDGHPLVFL